MSTTALPAVPEFQLHRDEQGRVVLQRPGQEDAVDVRIRRAFPWTHPSRYVSLRSSEGKELVLIDDLAALDADRRAFVEQELALVSFVPRIQRIERIDMQFGHQEWSVVTDRGPASFRVQEREDIRFLNDGRFRIKDADGNVYELARYDDLDAHSQRELEPLV
jgi:hypothetical protein